MPFVKQQRTYYKDGAVVPSSSITDFGKTKYFKNIVTTKYWKEITTGSKELAYAGYTAYVYNTNYYMYAKVPLGSDMKVYAYDNNASRWASDVSQIKGISNKWFVVQEDTANDSMATYTRSRENDLYIDTTTTTVVEGTPEDYTYTTEEVVSVEVTADDDYDYTEFVPSTQFDYYEDKNKLYQIVTPKRTYYKYGPDVTATIIGSPTIEEGIVSGFSASNYTRLPFTFEGGSYNNWELVTKIKVNSYSNGPAILCVNSSYGIFNYAIQTSGRVQLALSTNTDSFNICSDTGEKVLDLNTWYWYKAEFTGTAYNTYWSIDGKVWNLDSSVQNSTKLGNISALNFGIRTKLNDQILDGYIDMQETYFKANGVDVWHGTKVVESTEADADYYTDNIINHSPMTSKTKYYKYAYQDWEQPVLTENGTVGGDSFAVNQSSLLDSSEPNKAWNAFDGIGATTRWHSAQSLPAWISWYNPNPLKISNVEVTNRASSDGAYPNAYQLQYSDDNSTWVTAVSGNGTSGDSVSWDIPVEHDTFHRYWRLYITSSSGSNSGYTTVGEIVITAQEQITVETTSSDYDWYERRTKMY